MLNQLLPNNLNQLMQQINLDYLNEIRLRLNKPIAINLKGKNFFLSNTGVSSVAEDAVVCNKLMIEEILLNASNHSLYTVNDEMINGYISVSGGIRIGVAGEVVVQNGIVKTIKNINSLNIRIPHDVKNCSLNIYPMLVHNGQVKNTLIISAPGAGKTTFIRDFAYQLGKREQSLNILIADERGEISGLANSENGLDIGNFSDVITNCSKAFAFNNGIRSMKPDVIITDEINLDKDIIAIENALTSGVKVFATIHAKDIADLKNKKQFKEILNQKLFERYVVLNSVGGPGNCEGVYNENLVCIYC